MNYLDLTLEQEKSHNRFLHYKINKSLYVGNHFDVYKMSDYEYYINSNDYLVYNFFAILTDSFSDLIFAEDPKLLGDNQDQVDDIVESVDLLDIARQAVNVASYNGDAIIKITIVDDKPKISLIDNNIWYPIINEMTGEVDGHILKYKREDNYLLEIHKKGSIEYQAFKYQKATSDYIQVDCRQAFKDLVDNLTVSSTKSDLTLYIDTKCDKPLIIQLKNLELPNESLGVSDYTLPLIAKNKAINQLLNQSQYVLKKHAHPKMIVPKQLINQAVREIQANDNKAIEFGFDSKTAVLNQFKQDKTLLETMVASKIINKLEFYGSDINSTDPKYLTWDGNLDQSRLQYDVLKQACYDEAQLSKILVDPTLNTGNLSGVAILRLANQSINKAKRKQKRISKMMITAINIIEQLQGQTVSKINIQFKDGLINDLKETLENEVMQLDAQLTTAKRSIMTINNCTEEEAETIQSEINDQKALIIQE